jgi:hypothetical protein
MRRMDMNSMFDVQEIARRFNEDEAVRRSYERKRALRKRLALSSPLAEHVLDCLDWLEAEKECRMVRAIGFLPP